LHSAALAPAPAVVKTFFINSLIFNGPNPRKWPNPRRRVNGTGLKEGDGAAVFDTATLTLTSDTGSEVLVFDLA
ncbi:MAG TPA: hypothetical protein VFE90_13840, partial [Myxococcales bacterium]|nr:hypothetical protein [Myxococcales bacterium]